MYASLVGSLFAVTALVQPATEPTEALPVLGFQMPEIEGHERLIASLDAYAESAGVELDVHLRNLTNINSELKDKCEAALAALRELCGSDSLAARISCSICCTRERTHGLLPCGHAGLCEACSSRVVRRGRCHFCRGTVESNIRIFL